MTIIRDEASLFPAVWGDNLSPKDWKNEDLLAMSPLALFETMLSMQVTADGTPLSISEDSGGPLCIVKLPLLSDPAWRQLGDDDEIEQEICGVVRGLWDSDFNISHPTITLDLGVQRSLLLKCQHDNSPEVLEHFVKFLRSFDMAAVEKRISRKFFHYGPLRLSDGETAQWALRSDMKHTRTDFADSAVQTEHVRVLLYADEVMYEKGIMWHVLLGYKHKELAL